MTRTGHAEGDLDEFAAARLGVVDEIGLGQHDDRLGAAVERQDQLTLEPALVRGVAEGVGDEDDVDVGSEGVGLGAGALERRSADERRSPRQHMVDSLTVVGGHDPVTDGHGGADVAHPSDTVGDGRIGVTEDRAPAAVEAGDPSGHARRAELAPRRVEGIVPAQRAEGGGVDHRVSLPRRQWTSSMRPHSSAVAASITDPLRARAAVRWRPMRRGMLTVPPAPGTRPKATSGRAMRASGAAVT